MYLVVKPLRRERDEGLYFLRAWTWAIYLLKIPLITSLDEPDSDSDDEKKSDNFILEGLNPASSSVILRKPPRNFEHVSTIFAVLILFTSV